MHRKTKKTVECWRQIFTQISMSMSFAWQSFISDKLFFSLDLFRNIHLPNNPYIASRVLGKCCFWCCSQVSARRNSFFFFLFYVIVMDYICRNDKTDFFQRLKMYYFPSFFRCPFFIFFRIHTRMSKRLMCIDQFIASEKANNSESFLLQLLCDNAEILWPINIIP